MAAETASLRHDRHDSILLASLGYKQEFRRVFRPFEIFGFAFSSLCVVPACSVSLVYALSNGGPVSIVWGWIAVTPFTFAVALALAELASAAPTSGGLYYWTHGFAGPRSRNILSWIVGYTNTLAYSTGIAAGNWGIALMITAAAVIGSDGAWAASTADTFGIFAALTVTEALACSFASKVLARLQWVYITFNVVLVVVFVVGLPIATPKESMNTAQYVFGHFENREWPDGFAFVLSFLSPLFAFAGYDAPIHVSEEAANASITVPWAIVSAVGMASVMGWGVNVAATFCMGTDIVGILSDPIGQPMAVILHNSFGKSGMLAIWALAIVTYWMAITSLLSAGSRQVFAFARDGALPLSRWLYHMNPTTQTPIVCVWATALLAVLPGLLAFAGSAAIAAVFGMVIVALYITYAVPIAARLVSKRKFTPGPFTLGIFSRPVALVAVAWMSFASVVMLFPAAAHPTAKSMNYAIVVIGGIILLAMLYFYLPVWGGRCWFVGPRNNVAGDESQHAEKDWRGQGCSAG